MSTMDALPLSVHASLPWPQVDLLHVQPPRGLFQARESLRERFRVLGERHDESVLQLHPMTTPSTHHSDNIDNTNTIDNNYNQMKPGSTIITDVPDSFHETGEG